MILPYYQKLNWTKSTKCTSETCLEIAISGDNVYLRNSNDLTGECLVCNAGDWRSFLAGARNNEFDID